MNNAFGHAQVYDGAAVRLRRFQRLGVVLIVVVVAVAFGARPLYHRFKRQRAAALAAHAEELAGRDKWVEALPAMRAALALDAESPAALRLAAKYCSGAFDAAGLTYWEQLTHQGAPNRQDVEGYVELALGLGRVELAGEQIRRLKDLGPLTPAGWRLLVRYHVMAARLEAAVASARQAVKAYPEDESLQLVFGTLLAGSLQDASEREEGQRALRLVAFSSSPQSPRAAGFLVRTGGLSREEARALLNQWKSRPTSGFAERLARADFEVQVFPENREAAASAVQAEAGHGDSRSQTAAAGWLIEIGMAERALDLLPPHQRDAEPFSRRMEALGVLGRWDQVEAEIQEPGVPLTPALAETVQGIAAARSHNIPEARMHFEAALAGGRRLSSLIVKLVAESAERAGLLPEAIAAWIRLTHEPSVLREACDQVLRLAAAADAPADSVKALRRMRELEPSNVSLLADLAYVELLAGGLDWDLRDPLENAAKASEAAPETKAVQALAILRRGRPDEALRWMEGRLKISTNDSPRIRLIATAVYGANLQREPAREFASTLSASALKSAERELIRTWLP